ncbi:MAG: 4-vinyl reductase [Deltaproteobacteria bacterium]|nr:4-vinyl reductase [Deltaproteobacteria bacterium]
MQDRPYKFSWNFIGDIEDGRPNLGNTTRIEIYRLFQYTLRDVLEETYGTRDADQVLYKAGLLAGKEFCARFIGKHNSLDDFLGQVQQELLALNIGILRVEHSDPETAHFVLTMTEDLDCSGLPDMEQAVCTYDEGFIAGIFNTYTGREFEAKEIDCWCMGDRTCRFEVNPK